MDSRILILLIRLYSNPIVTYFATQVVPALAELEHNSASESLHFLEGKKRPCGSAILAPPPQSPLDLRAQGGCGRLRRNLVPCDSMEQRAVQVGCFQDSPLAVFDSSHRTRGLYGPFGVRAGN